MDYQIAKQLKDYGFKPKGYYEFICPHGMTTNLADISDDCKYSKVPLPTLSELIEACSEGFDGLTRMELGKRLEGWKSYGRTGGFSSGMIVSKGKTPEEAVANLWLALNKDLSTTS